MGTQNLSPYSVGGAVPLGNLWGSTEQYRIFLRVDAAI